MSRAVTSDHILFDECIDAFRREHDNPNAFDSGESYSFLLTSFELNREWKLGVCTVYPSIRVMLPGAYSAFISRVKNPDWAGTHNSHLFGVALATVVSAITLKNCKSTRDDYLCRSKNPSESDFQQLAILHPILTAGPGFTHPSISQAKQSKLENEISCVINKLMVLDYKTYRVVMQGLRLISLSISNKRDDFGLAYLLTISAIESIAQKAISRDKVKVKHPDENTWNEKAKDDACFKAVLEAYREARGKNQYLKERFVKFIFKYAPVSKWEEYIEHPMQDMADYIGQLNPSHRADHLVGKHWFEKYPSDLTDLEVEAILSDAYAHRSCFIHRGEQPPHTDPNPSLHRFFQELREYDGCNIKEAILPNYELMLGLAKNLILNWVNKKINK